MTDERTVWDGWYDGDPIPADTTEYDIQSMAGWLGWTPDLRAALIDRYEDRDRSDGSVR